jgi:hypothetical protein
MFIPLHTQHLVRWTVIFTATSFNVATVANVLLEFDDDLAIIETRQRPLAELRRRSGLPSPSIIFVPCGLFWNPDGGVREPIV